MKLKKLCLLVVILGIWLGFLGLPESTPSSKLAASQGGAPTAQSTTRVQDNTPRVTFQRLQGEQRSELARRFVADLQARLGPDSTRESRQPSIAYRATSVRLPGGLTKAEPGIGQLNVITVQVNPDGSLSTVCDTLQAAQTLLSGRQ